MKIISLGHACQVKHQIDTFYEKQEGNLFDWAIIDFKSVLYILKNINDKTIFSLSNITDKHVYLNRESWTKYIKIEHTDFKMIFVHHCMGFLTEELNNLISQCTRRLIRLKQLITSGEKIHMIHCIDHQFTEGYIPTVEDIFNFFSYINDICPNHKCILHIVVPPKYETTVEHLVRDNVCVYYLKDLKNGKPEYWQNYNFNWDIIFDNIKDLENMTSV
jgi:hypothetical protein